MSASTIRLDGVWKLYYYPQSEGGPKHPDELAKLELSPIPARVPGNVELDLSEAGVLPPDLLKGTNTELLRRYEGYEWWYITEFDSPQPAVAAKEIRLVFHGVDCLAAYWLNGRQLGTSRNMFIEHKFEVRELLRPAGEANCLAVRLSSPLLAAMDKIYDPSPWAWPIDWDRLWIRKAQHSYGWDIMPRALSAGIWRSVELELPEEHEITELYAVTESVNEGKAVLKLFYQCRTCPEYVLENELKLRIRGICGDSSFEVKKDLRFTAGSFHLEVPNPKLWWPAGYGAPELYELEAELLYKGKTIASRKDRIGIRRIEVLRTEATDGGSNGQFLFRANGVPILVKGTNWVPADVFHSRDRERIPALFQLLTDLNCNMVRCWGGNVYEDHDFFRLCDENGVMVWQDFSLACAPYPQDGEFLEEIRKEAVSVVRKLRGHTSIVLWSGDNECDLFYPDPSANRITREVLPQVIAQCDPYRPFLPSSPYQSAKYIEGREAQGRFMPEDHLWGPRDYYKSAFYTQSRAHFVSEIGYHGCPNVSSIRRFIDPGRVWPWQENEQWILHSTDRSGNPYRIQLMSHQIRETFGEIPDQLEDYALASQIVQAEAYKFFIERTRLHKWNKSGILWWNLVDGWPQFSDAVVDYYLGKKLAYYYIRRIQQPLCIMVDEPEGWKVRVVAGNDSSRSIRGTYRIWDSSSQVTLLEGDFETSPNENKLLGHIPVYRSEQRLLLIQWTIEGRTYGNHSLLGSPAFSLEAYRSWLPHLAGLQNDFKTEEIGK